MLPTYKDIGGRLAAAGLAANQAAWKFNITHANQAEFLIYPAGGRYVSHVDTFLQHSDETRKLTVLAFLNDDFKGGKFYLMNGHEKYYPPQKKGTVLVFPAFMMHGVEDVEEGQRCSVVTWMVGPFFK
jgi:PKHD-type hydroxylase